jgi:predicted transposase YbfD/YdcC
VRKTVPAVSSSPISPALEQLQDLPAGDRALLSGHCPGLAEHLGRVPDPRDPRGVRHTLTSLLLAAVAAVLPGARSFTALGEWVADAPPQVLASLGIRRDPLTGRFEPPDEATIRRVLESVDAAALDAAVGSWLNARARAAAQWPAHGRRWRRALAVDGKAVRGTRHASSDGQAVHLLAIIDQQVSTVLAQAGVDGKTNEITQFAPLLEPLDLAECVITADAMHTQREHAEFLITQKKAHYLLVVKKNQPSLYAQVKNLPWRTIPAGHRQRDRGHGRAEHRTLKATAVTAGLAFPHAAQAICLNRRIRPLGGGKWRTVTVYAITSLNASQATPAQLAEWIRGHWQIEVLHHIRDVSYGEDASQIRTGSGPQAMATLRNLAIGILKTTGHTSIAAACRHHGRDATRTLATLGLSPP